MNDELDIMKIAKELIAVNEKNITRKMVPITWRASPLLVFLYLHEEVGGFRNVKEEETEQTY